MVIAADVRVGGDSRLPAPGSTTWLESAATRPGSWWPDWLSWLEGYAGEGRVAPKKLGSAKCQVTAKAPGTYVHAT
jgi:polyhydroxyalkanoate synthase